MPNRSHFNAAHRMMNFIRKEGVTHSSDRAFVLPEKTHHAVIVSDAAELLRSVRDASVQLVVCDPPYNLDMASWDRFNIYSNWASSWLDEVPRVLKDTGSVAIFGGFQFQNERGGDLLDIISYLRKNGRLRLINVIVWHYRNGMSAHRFFANRHEEIVWFAKSARYTFNLDEVRVPYDEETKKQYLRDPRLKPETIEKGKNPTNVWEIPRLNGNSAERVGHPTQKPVEVVRRLVKALSCPGDVVMDFFAGSGSTTRVCVEEGRHSIGSDADPMWPDFLSRQLAQLGALALTRYEILRGPTISSHPVFQGIFQEEPVLPQAATPAVHMAETR